MQWISVKDRLPEQDENMCPHDWVLVYAQGGAGPSHRVSFAQRYDNKWEIFHEEGVHSCTGSYDLDEKDITHWMRIPHPEDYSKMCDGKLIKVNNGI